MQQIAHQCKYCIAQIMHITNIQNDDLNQYDKKQKVISYYIFKNRVCKISIGRIINEKY